MGNKIDFNKLNYYDEPLSMEEALKDVVPLKLDDEVINGDKKIRVVGASVERETRCVKLEALTIIH